MESAAFGDKRMKAFILVVFCAVSIIAAQNPSIEITEIERSHEQSVHQVRIYSREEPHRHAHHDSDVVIESGGGTLYLNERPVRLKPGDRITILRNVPHYFVNESGEPFTQARVTFTPAFDGKDRLPVGAAAPRATLSTRVIRWLERLAQWSRGVFVFRS